MSSDPAEVIIAEHRYRPQDHSTIEGNAYCVCGWSARLVNSHKTAVDLHAAHVVAAIRDSGYTVIALPEADGDGAFTSGRFSAKVGVFEQVSLVVGGEHWGSMAPSAAVDLAITAYAAAQHAGDTQ